MSAVDAALRARIESALVGHLRSPVVVTTEAAGIADLRAAHPGCALVAVGLRRAAIPAALDAGADVAVSGALRPAELRARLRAVDRRHARTQRVGALVLDRAARTVSLEDGTQLRLSAREFALLCQLATAPGRTFTKAELTRQLPGASARRSRSLERQAVRLRRRLGAHAPMLVTVWGVGYRLDEPV